MHGHAREKQRAWNSYWNFFLIQRSIASLKIFSYLSEKELATLLSWAFIFSFCFFI